MPFLNGNTSLIQTTSYQIYPATNCTYPVVTPATIPVTTLPYYCVTHKLPYYVASESFVISVPSIRNSSQAITGLSKIPGIQLQGVQAALSTGLQGTLNRRRCPWRSRTPPAKRSCSRAGECTSPWRT